MRKLASLVNFAPYSDRIVMLQLQSNTGTVIDIQVNTPRADRDDEEIGEFNFNLDEIFKVKIGQGSVGRSIGEFGL